MKIKFLEFDSKLSRRAKWLIVLIMLFSLVFLIWQGVALYQLWRAVQAVQADVDALKGVAKGQTKEVDLAQVMTMFEQTQTDLYRLEAAARPYLWTVPALRRLPILGDDVEAASLLLSISVDLMHAVDPLIEQAQPLLEQVAARSDLQTSILPQIVDVLPQMQPNLEMLLLAVQRAQTTRAQINTDGLLPRLQRVVAQFDSLLALLTQTGELNPQLTWLETGVRSVEFLPRLLGIERPFTCLVLIQNEDELRAGGGFISAVARLTVQNAQLTELAFEDSYAVDDYRYPYPDPPAPLLKYMRSEIWVFRDSNWSPDFPTSAQMAISLYQIGRDFHVDGVIAVDQQAIRAFVDAVGPLQVPEVEEPLTGENVIRIAREMYSPGEQMTKEWLFKRKEIMGWVLNSAAQHLQKESGPKDLIRLFRAAVQMAEQRHLLFYVRDEQIAALLADLGWDGALRSSVGDYLMVVDSNLGFNKANGLVTQQLDYLVDLRDLNHPLATLTVRHTHHAASDDHLCLHKSYYDPTYEQMMARCYWNYMRVYVPWNSQLIGATPHAVSGAELLSGQPSPAEVWLDPPECGRTVWATFMLLRRGATLETQFEYALPAGVIQRRKKGVNYTLLIQKQPGTIAVPVQVHLILPVGMQAVTSDPQAIAEENRLTWVFDLHTDRIVRVELSEISK